MPTIISHPIPTACIGLALGRTAVPWRLLVAGIVCSLLPDLDVIGFSFGVQYTDALGHRGFSHSLMTAFLVGCVAVVIAPWLKSSRLMAFLVCTGSVVGHILLDAMTSGGFGVAFFWPWSDERFFLPWRPIRVSPISLSQFFSLEGLAVLLSEFLWIWLPSVLSMLLIVRFRRRNTYRPPSHIKYPRPRR